MKDDGCAEEISVGRGPPIRPHAVRVTKDGEAGSKQALAAAAALDWQPPMSEKNCEGSATSDEDHPRRALKLVFCCAQMAVRTSVVFCVQ